MKLRLLAVPIALASCAGNQKPVAADAREGYIESAGGVRLFYRIAGTGQDTIVVLHGGPGYSMAYLAPDLEPLTSQHVLIFYDQRGAGRSTLITDSASLDAERFADDLEAVRARFKLEKLTLFAHSWGAAVAALYTSHHADRIARMIIVDGISIRRTHHLNGLQTMDRRRDSVTRARLQELGSQRNADPGSEALCRMYFEIFFRATFTDPAVLDKTKGDFCAGRPDAIANKIKSVDRFTIRSLGDWDWRPSLRAVAAPTLIIRGRDDHVPLASSIEWAGAVQHGVFFELRHSGHFPYLEQPEVFFGAVEEFLAGRWPAEAKSTSAGGLP
jgi:proline iminopeptidase